MGRFKSQKLNVKKSNVALAMKKQEKFKKSKKKSNLSDIVDASGDVIMMDLEARQEEATTQPEKPVRVKKMVQKLKGKKKMRAIAARDKANQVKGTPRLNEQRLRTTELPLVVTQKTARKPNSSCNVVHSQPMSKKKAKKIEKALRNSKREQMEAENAMV